MSTVTSVVLICHAMDEDIVEKLSSVFRANPSANGHDLGEDLTTVGSLTGKHTGGRKNPEVSVYAAGFNGSFDAIDELVSNFPHAGWTCPDEVVMIISRQQSDRFEILYPRGADR